MIDRDIVDRIKLKVKQIEETSKEEIKRSMELSNIQQIKPIKKTRQ